MPIDDFINPHLKKLIANEKVEDKEISSRLELILVDHPVNPFGFKDCTFNVSPTLPADPFHGHPGLVFDHCTFKKPLTLAKRKFFREVIFRSCRFERYVDFTGSCFSHGVSFEDCAFDEKAYFENAVFGINLERPNKDADAHKNCHCCTLWLTEVVAPRAKHCLPMDCSAPEHDHKSKACANFWAAVFNDGAEFDYATFHVPACFHKTTWHKATTFLQCQFPLQCRFPVVKGGTSGKNIINFSHAQISGSVEFNQSLRPSNDRSNKHKRPYKDGEISEECILANFKYIHIQGHHGLRFHTENLKCCSVLGTNLDACHFSNVRWPKVETYYRLTLQESLAFLDTFGHNLKNWQNWKLWGLIRAIRHITVLICLGSLYLAHKILAWLVRFPTRWLVPHRSDDKGTDRTLNFVEYFRSCWTLKQYCIWDHQIQNEDQDNALCSNDSRQVAVEIEGEVSHWRNQWALLSRAYRDLKTAYEENKDYIYASDFHYAEKEFRRINYEVPRQIRIQLQLYWLVSGYGERVLRPIWWFLVICILGAVPYYLWGDRAKPKEPSCGIVELCKPEISLTIGDASDIIGSSYDLIGSILSMIGLVLSSGGWFVGLIVISTIYVYCDGKGLLEWIIFLFLSGLLFGLIFWGIDTLAQFFHRVPVVKKVCFREALSYSAETMGFLKPTNLDLGEGISWLRILSWTQTVAGPFLFVMFSLALKNKLKR